MLMKKHCPSLFLLLFWSFYSFAQPLPFASYSFNDGTANDNSGMVNGAITGPVSPIADRFGNPGYALAFGDASAVSFGDNFDLFSTLDAQFSFSVWIKNKDLNTTNVLFLSKYGNDNCAEDQREFFVRINDDNKIEFLFYSSLNTNVFHGIEGDDIIADSCWHHIVVNYDGSIDDNNGLDRIEIYVDGRKNETQFSPSLTGQAGDIQNSTAHLSLGTPLNSNGDLCFFNSFIGVIDDLAFFDQILSQDEINRLFRSPSPTRTQNTVNANFSISGDLLCQGDCVQITDESSSELCNTSARWIFPGGELGQGSSQRPQSICFPNPGIYQIIHILGNDFLKDTFIQTVTIIPNTLDILGADTLICDGESLELNAQTPNATYLWSTGSTASSITVFRRGTYWVELTNDGCPQRDSINVQTLETPSPSLGPDDGLCQGESIVIDATTDLAESYRWQDGSTEPLLAVVSEGLYVVEAINDCGVGMDSIVISLRGSSVFVDLGNDLGICAGDSVVLDATNPDATTYLWNTGSESPALTVTTPGIYQVTISNECFEDSDEIQVSDKDCCPVFVPNVFSPNGDGINDSFQPLTNCSLVSYRMRIFDRWGSLLFESNDPDRSWNGRYNNQELPQEAYTWFLEYDDGNGTRLDAGTVMLIK